MHCSDDVEVGCVFSPKMEEDFKFTECYFISYVLQTRVKHRLYRFDKETSM